MPFLNQPAPDLCVGTHRHEPDRPRRAVEGTWWCVGCYHHAERLIRDTPALVDDLERAQLRSSGGGPKVTGTFDTSLSYNEKAGACRRDLIEFSRQWTLVVAKDCGVALPDDTSLTGRAAFLGLWLPWIATQPFAQEFIDNLRADCGAARGALAEQRTRRLPLGRCVEHDRCDVQSHDEQPCTGTIVAVVDLTDDLLPAAVACDTCGRQHTARELPALGQRLTGGKRWLTTAQAASVLGLSEGRLRAVADEQRWVRRDAERVRPVRWDADAVDKYRKQQDAFRREAAERKARRSA